MWDLNVFVSVVIFYSTIAVVRRAQHESSLTCVKEPASRRISTLFCLAAERKGKHWLSAWGNEPEPWITWFWVTWRPGLQKWTDLDWASGIGMAQTSFTSTHHACRAWLQKGAFSKAWKLASFYTRINGQRPPQKNQICSYGCWAKQCHHPLGFLILPESAHFCQWGDAFSTGFSAMVKALKEWASDKTEEVNVQTRISSANTGRVRRSQEAVWTNFSFQERIRANSSWNLDWIFGGWKGFNPSYKSGMANMDFFASFHSTEQTTIFNEMQEGRSWQGCIIKTMNQY